MRSVCGHGIGWTAIEMYGLWVESNGYFTSHTVAEIGARLQRVRNHK